MTWFAFDRPTAEKLAQLEVRHCGIERLDSEPLPAAIRNSRPSILLLPASNSGEVLLLHIRKNSSQRQPRPEPIAYTATGFLGLNDEPVFLDEEPAAPKKWWKKILD